MGPAPERHDHPVLHRAAADARSHRAVWRARFGVPITDPRYLTATDADILHDLLVIAYQNAGERMRDPQTALEHVAATSPDVLEAQEAEALEAAQPGGALNAGLWAMLKRQPKPKGEPEARKRFRILRTTEAPP